MAVRIREQPYHDAVGRSHRRRRRTRRTWLSVVIAGLTGAILWLFLFSSLLSVTDVTVHGAAGIGDENVARAVRDLLTQRKLSVFPLRNMILLESAAITNHVKSVYPGVQTVQVVKQYPHTLQIDVTERQPTGIWCRGQECQFWDRSGGRWGNPFPSVGPLLLLVQDERSDAALSAGMFENLLAAVDALPQFGLRARSVRLPDGEPGGARITTDRKYDVYLDALGNIAEQLDALGIFLADKAKDVTFSPQYIDLRTPGRIYYK